MLKLIGIPVTTFIVCALIGPVLIPYLHKLKFGQSIRECGPASHMAKSGTPTMGGIMMLAALLVALLWGNFTPHVIIALVLTVGHAVIGFIDDYIKVVMKRNLGLTAKQKFYCSSFWPVPMYISPKRISAIRSCGFPASMLSLI